MRLQDWLPRFCSRLRIFVSYASEDRPLAERIAQVLVNAGHRVFFDKDSLPAAGDYNERIRAAVRTSDRFLFLASRRSLEAGKYTLSELDFARQRWASPVGRVFPVVIDPDLPPEAMPVYLSSVQAVSVAGNAPAEIAAAIERTSGVSGTCRLCLAALAIVLAGALGIGVGLVPMPGPAARADVAVVPVEYVIFRPRARPPDNPAAADADTAWTRSPVTVTLPVAYSSRDARSAPAQLQREDVVVRIGEEPDEYAWAYVVEINSGSVGGTRCAEWLCQKANVKAETLKPGEMSATRETMFLPVPEKMRTWQSLIDRVLSPDGPKTMVVVLRSHLLVPGGSIHTPTVSEHVCSIDLVGTRERMIGAGFQAGRDPRPAAWQPRCTVQR